MTIDRDNQKIEDIDDFKDEGFRTNKNLKNFDCFDDPYTP